MGVQLSKHFTLAELTITGTGIPNTVDTEQQLVNITHTALGLEVIRGVDNVPIHVNSGYRNAQVNAAVGGVPNSAHTLGWAADIMKQGMSSLNLAKQVQALMQPGKPLYGRVDQLIHETSRSVVHVSFDPRARGQVLTQKGGPGTPTTPGL